MLQLSLCLVVYVSVFGGVRSSSAVVVSAMRLVIGWQCLFVWFVAVGRVQADANVGGGGVAQKKVSVTEVTVDSSVEDIQWAGADHRTVLLKTHSGRLYRSQDAGKQLTEITGQLTGGGLGPTTPVTVDSILVSPVEKNIVLVVGSKRNHFISEDSGSTFRRVQHSSAIHSWIFHPLKPRWALLSAWTDACFTTTAATSAGCNHLLYVTRDMGQSFSLISSYVVQFSWGDRTLSQEDRIYFTHHNTRHGDQPRAGGWSQNVDFSVSTDIGKSSRVLVSRGNKFLVSNGFVFVARLADPIQQTVKMLVSSGGQDKFEQALLPDDAVHEKSYTILDTSEGAIMLHVNHGAEGKSNTGNVYISDATGLRYSLSLPNNVRTVSGECEFDKVLSLEGVYIANFKDDLEQISNAPNTSGSSEEVDESAGETAVERKRRNKGKTEDIVRSVISFDKGGKWSFLVPPKVDSVGKPTECAKDVTGNCWLHLHGISNFHQYAPFYSVENAVGIIMGTGNIGPHLRFEPDEVNTYLSRDGGLTWVEAHKGAYIYEFGDHGGLMVMADDIRKTKQVVFSWNEGQSWFDFELGEYPIDVDNIVIEPNSSSVEFLLYGTRGAAGVIYYLNFMALGQPACRSVYGADSVSSDYETWIPTDGRGGGSKCMLGREVTYTRRKQTSECFNGQDFTRPVVKKNCVCTKEDYECEFGFARRVGSLECKPKSSSLMNQEGCTSASYFYTFPYRKVPGNSCEGGWEPEKVAVACSFHSPFSRGARSILLFILFIAFVMFALTYSSRSPRLKHLFKNYGFSSFTAVQYSVLGRPRRKDSEDIILDAAAASCKYEPELGFIDSEQDEHDEDAPTLMSYHGDEERTDSFPTFDRKNKKRSSQRQSELLLQDEDGDDLENQPQTTRAEPRSPVPLPTNTVPRLAPPPGSGANLEDDSLELL
eukprot:GHVS01017475.1.p1 GENE.GHVS01017475.1~~GHVS01017475.1.p1  ORF type:complete len:935 (+),score=103.33 GHVS01017475.1:271-3075(+)